MLGLQLVSNESGWFKRDCWSGLGLQHGGQGWLRVALATLTLWALLFCSSPVAWTQTLGTNRAAPKWREAKETAPGVQAATRAGAVPPRVLQARRFLAGRGWRPDQRRRLSGRLVSNATQLQGSSRTLASVNATWTSLGPAAVLTPHYGLVTGRISSLALDPSDATGNQLYLGTTGGGVWGAQNAGTSLASNVVFRPLTDNLTGLLFAVDPSISIGALTVQPGGTGVILAGTGDPNDALDSYYGSGVLRSADGGNSWALIQGTGDQKWSFTGEGFAGFAWSTHNPQLVVAAVSQAYEGTLVNATWPQRSYEGLYYSLDAGATWSLATITDGNGADLQGPTDAFAGPDGNAATSVVWNPVRQVFVAAVRLHGYYQSTDGVTWTRMSLQPGAGLTTQVCPTNPGSTGSIGCPLFRGTLAVNPQTGDTFAWTVDIDNQDQGLWQDQCAVSQGACANQSVAFQQQWSTVGLETDTALGAATIENGDYNLALAAVPYGLGQGADTWLLAGANDLWKCSLAMGCVWRNTTNANTCMSAQVGGYQHALAWSAGNPLEIFVGNDSGLWRSMDAIGETGAVCADADSSHFQNLNGSLGSLAEVVSMAVGTPTSMMAGLGVNGTAEMSGGAAETADWQQVLSGGGGPVQLDSTKTSTWYVNNEEGVSIYACSEATACTPTAFGVSPVVTDADVGGDGFTMTTPAPFLVDAADSMQLLIGTCRVWRGPANGKGWGASDAISPVLDGGQAAHSCAGDSLIRSMAAMALPGGGEVIYVGMAGWADGSIQIPGHVLSATISSDSSAEPVWTDLTLNPVSNDVRSFNYYGLSISSLSIDSHDATGKTVYATVQGVQDAAEVVRTVYRSQDGGAHWDNLMANLPSVPANSLMVDPQDANTVYVATDAGVFFTTRAAQCGNANSNCWSIFGTGLPQAPAVQLSAAGIGGSTPVLVAATYGRGVWQTPLWTAGTGQTIVTVSPATLDFGSQVKGAASASQTVTLTNTGSVDLAPTAIQMSGDFSETDDCQKQTISAGGNCAIQVVFTPTATGSRAGQMTIAANVYGGQLGVALSGTGTPAGVVTLTPPKVDFGQVEVGTTSATMPVAAGNNGTVATSIQGISVTGPFNLASNTCGTSSFAANSSCQMMLTFAPLESGAATGMLTVIDAAGTQTVSLTGTGGSAPTDIVSPTSLTFDGVATGLVSPSQTVKLTNQGDLPLTSIATTISGAFQVSKDCSTQLSGHSVCTLTVVSAPTQVGAQSGTLTISDLLRTQTVSLSGMGLAPAAFGVVPASLTFPSQQVGGTAAPLTLTVSNTGGAPLTNVGFQLTGSGASSFSTASPTCGQMLASGSNCTVQVIFAPAAAGAATATLTVTSSTQGVAAVTVPLSGSGTVTTGINVSPAQLAFSTVVVGQQSPGQTVTISNAGGLPAASLTLTITPPFLVAQTSCGSSLAAGANCTAQVVFAPTVVGAATGTLTINSAAGATPATVLLGGTGGTAAALQVTPSAMDFAETGVGTQSSPKTLTVTNLGTMTALSNLVLAAPNGFQVTNNTCTATLAPGASCTAGVEFAPVSAGQQAGTLTVSTSTLTSGATVPLSGMGFDFTLTAVNSSSQSAASGQTASYTFAIAPQSGSQGAFTYQCGTLPANAVCLFSPNSETIAAGGTGNVTASISTGKSGTAAYRPRVGTTNALELACGLVLLGLGCRRLKGLSRVVLMVALAVGISSCSSSGGGSGGSGGSGGGSGVGSTPAGTYSIDVTVTSTGVQHTLTLTLIVD